ncbi:MAG: FHA domain-containing protein [Gemmatimonadetes bacterium]|nr:FHA domain-containing protein [Gemmatimonadota bacterium]
MRKQLIFPIFVAVAAWSLFPRDLGARINVDVVSESIVRVRAYENNQVAVEGAGFVVNEMGHVLTNAHLVEKAERVTVLSLKTDAETIPEQVFADRKKNLALLQTQNSNPTPLRLDEKEADAGRTVGALRFGVMGDVSLSQGTISTWETIFEKKAGRPVGRLLQHNALISAKAFGMPLFNECGDVVAINMPNPRGEPWPFRTAKPKGAVFALSSKDMVAALDDREIAHQAVNTECLSALERAERDKLAVADSLKLARAEADSAIKAATEAGEKEKFARQEAERVKARADAAQRAATRSIQAARARAESLKRGTTRAVTAEKAAPDSLLTSKVHTDSLETGKAFPDSATDEVAGSSEQPAREIPLSLKWGIPIGGGLVLLTLLGWLLASHRRNEQLRSAESRLSAAHQAAAAAPKPAPFRCLLEGRDSSGREFALTISALALGDPAGVTLGRSPTNADFVVDHEEVSREHVRLRCTGPTLYAEDLNALNGTRVNGRLLNPEERAALQNGDQLETGPIVFSVRLVRE